VSSDFKDVLRERIEGLVNNRLAAVESAIESSRREVDEVLGRIRESIATSSDAHGEPEFDQIAAEINAQIGQAAAESSRLSGDLALLRDSVVDIDSQQTQADVLTALVARAASFAPRVILFVVKGDDAIAWAARGFDDEIGDDAVRGLSVSLRADTLLGAVLQAQKTFLGEPGDRPDNAVLLDRLGSTRPERVGGVPLRVRAKTVGILYADSYDTSVGSIGMEALELLVHSAGLIVELASLRQRVADPSARPQSGEHVATAVSVESTAASTAAAIEYATPAVEETAAAEPEPEPVPEPEAVPEFEPEPEPEPEPEAEAIEPELVEAPGVEAGVDEASAEPEAFLDVEPTPEVEAPGSQVWVEPEAESSQPFGSPFEITVEPEPEPAPSFDFAEQGPSFELADLPAEEMEAPVVEAEPELEPDERPTEQWAAESASVSDGAGVERAAPPVAGELSPEEEKLHNDARRFARLLVSEIKLYNEQQVAEGRQNYDLYDRLKDDIDRSRQMYDKRVAASVAERFDYFFDELVNTLAEGESSKLGADCPGPTV
jgi:hypothetical protein